MSDIIKMNKIKANEALSPISNLSKKKFNLILLETLFTKVKIFLSKLFIKYTLISFFYIFLYEVDLIYKLKLKLTTHL